MSVVEFTTIFILAVLIAIFGGSALMQGYFAPLPSVSEDVDGIASRG